VKVIFGEWTLDTDTRQLCRGVTELHLSTKAFDLLALLVQARPRVVTKAELQEALWQDVFVSEASLFTLVSEIRHAVEDSPRGSGFLRTVHGVGYAFSGEAIEVPRVGVPHAATTPACVIVWENRRFPLPEGEHVIGRDPDIAVMLDSTGVSRRHARLHVTGDSASIEDLQSKNGTFVNDVRVADRAPLRDGDRLRFGSLLTTFRRGGPASSTETEHE
jgi:DNA-binding winged helix-turn-helix (wHTH) protein